MPRLFGPENSVQTATITGHGPIDIDMKPLIVILSLLCLGLAAQVFLRQGGGARAMKDLVVTTANVQTFSNAVVETQAKLEEETKMASYLQSNLTLRANDLASASNNLEQSSAALVAAQTELKTVQAEAQKQTARVTELEGQKDEMQVKLTELAGSIKSLNVQINEAKRRLAAAIRRFVRDDRITAHVQHQPGQDEDHLQRGRRQRPQRPPVRREQPGRRQREPEEGSSAQAAVHPGE